MNGIQTVKAWIGALTNLGLALIALAIVASVLVGPEEHVGVRECGGALGQPNRVARRWRFGGAHRGRHHYLAAGEGCYISLDRPMWRRRLVARAGGMGDACEPGGGGGAASPPPLVLTGAGLNVARFPRKGEAVPVAVRGADVPGRSRDCPHLSDSGPVLGSVRGIGGRKRHGLCRRHTGAEFHWHRAHPGARLSHSAARLK